MNTCDYLARVGFDRLLARLGGPSVPEWADEDDQKALDAAAEAARVRDHCRVLDALIDPEAKPLPRAGELTGARWLDTVITWPDRVPDLKPWAGRSTLPQIITQRRAALKKVSDADRETLDLFTWATFPAPVPKVKAGKKGATPDPDAEDLREGEGHSGIDSLPCQDARDVGFSPGELGIPVQYRPAAELLAILGLETLPLVSFGPRECGFVHAGRVWQFTVEPRDGGYRYRWGDVSEHRHPEPAFA